MTGTLNVYSLFTREIEEFLHGHPSIAEVQAIGVYDARFKLKTFAIYGIFMKILFTIFNVC